jgi:hypothetical protein
MGLERLIEREKPQNIFNGTVLQIMERDGRVKVLGRNSTELWASYLPSDFPGLLPGHTVAVGIAGAQTFLLRRVSSTLPASTSLIEL